jgi:hypothetical protein
VVVPLNLVATGPPGGPFSPSSFQYRIRATTETISYSINAPPWVTADPSWLLDPSKRGRLSLAAQEGLMLAARLLQKGESVFHIFEAVVRGDNDRALVGARSAIILSAIAVIRRRHGAMRTDSGCYRS